MSKGFFSLTLAPIFCSKFGKKNPRETPNPTFSPSSPFFFVVRVYFHTKPFPSWLPASLGEAVSQAIPWETQCLQPAPAHGSWEDHWPVGTEQGAAEVSPLSPFMVKTDGARSHLWEGLRKWSREGKLKKIVYMLAEYRWCHTCQVKDGYFMASCASLLILCFHSQWDFPVAYCSKAIGDLLHLAAVVLEACWAQLWVELCSPSGPQFS